MSVATSVIDLPPHTVNRLSHFEPHANRTDSSEDDTTGAALSPNCPYQSTHLSSPETRPAEFAIQVVRLRVVHCIYVALVPY